MRKNLFIIVFSLLIHGCKKFTEVDFPVNQVVSDDVFENESTARAAVSGIYAEITGNGNQIASGAFTFNAGMSADELTYYSDDYRQEFYENNLSAQSHPYIAAQLWGPAYKSIYACNLSLEKLAASEKLSALTKDKLTGECLYLRSWFYFMMVNLFGDVPLCTSSDYRVNSTQPRTTSTVVYGQIIEDLQKAALLLPVEYGHNERTTVNKWAAKALLAKAYLFKGQWDSAHMVSDEVIRSGIYQLEPNLADVFLRTSRETLWQIASVIPTRNSWEGFYIIPNSANSLPTYLVRPELVNQFEAGDGRRTSWIKQRTYAGDVLLYPNKYKVKQNAAITEFQIVMRLAEVLLIRAESNLEQNNVNDAVADINLLRARAGLVTISNNINQDSCRRLMIKERSCELFAEWGNRWLDLKRWNKADEVLGNLKGANWITTDKLYPIPQNQIDLNSNLIQNPGY